MSRSTRKGARKPGGGASSAERRELFLALYRESLALQRARPWEAISSDDLFVVHVPTEPHPISLSVMGSGGEQFGLGLIRGPRGVTMMRRIITGEAQTSHEREAGDYLSLTFDRVRDVPPELLRYLKSIGVTAKGSAVVPTFLAKPSFKLTRTITDDEAVTLVVITRAVLATLEDGSLLEHPSPAEGDRLVTLRITGDLDEPEYAVSLEPPPSEHTEPAPSFLVDIERLERLPRLGATWSVSLVTMPIVIEGSDETTRGLLVVDLTSERVLSAHAVQGERATYEAADHLLEVFAGRSEIGESVGLPREIVFHEPALHEVLAPWLTRVGVRCVVHLELPPVVRGFVASLSRHFGAEIPEEALEREPPRRVVEVPAPDDFDGWRSALDGTIRLCLEHLDRSDYDLKRLGAKYFGSAAARDAIVESDEGRLASTSFAEWVLFDHRPRGGRTLAEALLEEQLSPAGRAVLQAIVSATTSLYRVASVEPGRSLTLEDLLRGGRVTVQERSGFRETLTGVCFASRVVQLGGLSFTTMPGRVVAPMMIGAAQVFLEQSGLRTTPAGLRDGAHLFGRLWAWTRDHASAVQFANTDGEPFEFHEARFEVTEPARAMAALEARPDVEKVDDGEYIWTKPSSKASVMPGPITLANLAVEGDQLVAWVNSAGRWDRLREWLGRVDGLRFQRVERRELPDEPTQSSPPEPRRRAPVPPEVVEALRGKLVEIQLRWVDEPIPALGGLTPREAVKTAAGRRKVQQMIRSMPAVPIGGTGEVIEPPRDQIRRALRLPEEDLER